MENDELQIPQEALDQLKNPDILRRQMEEGKTFQEVIGYTAESMEKFYQAAYRLFQKQEYSDAGNAFLFLTTLNTYVYSYWLGLGMCEQLCGDFHGALLAYAMATLLNIPHPIPYYHSASCYEAINDRINAQIALEQCVRYCEDKSEFSELKERGGKLLERYQTD